MGKIKGSFVRKNNQIKLNSNLKEKMAMEGTLIHEIQHAIQKIEGFKRGRSSKGSKLAYYNSLGEIEADDTKNRYIAEKQGTLSRDITPPESSKMNPIHSRVDNYLNNRTTFDKIKDGIYKYLSDRGVLSDSISEEFDTEDSRQNTNLVVGRRGYIKGLEDSSSFSLGQNLPKTDNKGRQLTKEQQEEFKNSKVRDENGNLKVMYHGTDADLWPKYKKSIFRHKETNANWRKNDVKK